MVDQSLVHASHIEAGLSVVGGGGSRSWYVITSASIQSSSFSCVYCQLAMVMLWRT
jgi:hypothetical protein